MGWNLTQLSKEEKIRARKMSREERIKSYGCVTRWDWFVASGKAEILYHCLIFSTSLGLFLLLTLCHNDISYFFQSSTFLSWLGRVFNLIAIIGIGYIIYCARRYLIDNKGLRPVWATIWCMLALLGMIFSILIIV